MPPPGFKSLMLRARVPVPFRYGDPLPDLGGNPQNIYTSPAPFFRRRGNLLSTQHLGDNAGRVLLAAVVQMGVDIGGGGESAVAEPFLDLLHRHSVGQHQAGTAVPLRYNYDKPEKPRRIKGFEVFSLVFSSFSKPKNHTEISRIIGGVSLTTNE